MFALKLYNPSAPVVLQRRLMRVPLSSYSVFGEGAKSCQEETASSALSLFTTSVQLLWRPLSLGKLSKLSGYCSLRALLNPGEQTNKNNPQRRVEGGAQVFGFWEGEGRETAERLRRLHSAGDVTGDVTRHDKGRNNKIIRCSCSNKQRTGHCREHVVPLKTHSVR